MKNRLILFDEKTRILFPKHTLNSKYIENFKIYFDRLESKMFLNLYFKNIHIH